MVWPAALKIAVLVKPFMWALIISTLPLLLFMNAKQFTDGLGFTRIATEITLLGLLINIVLNVGFIYGRWGFPAWGLFGAGISTLIARVFMAVFIYLYILRSKFFAGYRQLSQAYSWINFPYIFFFQANDCQSLPSGFQYFFLSRCLYYSGITYRPYGYNATGCAPGFAFECCIGYVYDGYRSFCWWGDTWWVMPMEGETGLM